MEKIQEVLARSTESGSREKNEQPGVQQPEKVIERLWNRMTQLYGHKWTSSYGEFDQDDTWAMGLADLSLDQIKTGFVSCLDSDEEWPLTLPQFRQLCKAGKPDVPYVPQIPHRLSMEQKTKGQANISALIQKLKTNASV